MSVSRNHFSVRFIQSIAIFARCLMMRKNCLRLLNHLNADELKVVSLGSLMMDVTRVTL